MMFRRWVAACAAAAALAVTPASAQIAVSANDNKLVLVDGVNTVVRSPAPDTVTVLDLSGATPKILGTVQAPNSVIGPPTNVAIAPGGRVALVTSSTRVDPADATKTVPDDTVSVIELQPTPRVVATLHAGRGASGVSISPAGDLALVANRIDGTVSVFAVNGTTVTPAGLVDFGAPNCGPSHVVFTRDGRRALVTRNNDSLISLLAVTGRSVAYTKRDIAAGVKPYAIDVTPVGDAAVVGHIGVGATLGVDTLAVIDLAPAATRTVDQVAAGVTIEGLSISPNGRFVAATIMNGSNLAASSPLFRPTGTLRVFRLDQMHLTPLAEAPTGRWCQGLGWRGDSAAIVVQCVTDRQLRVYGFDGRVLSASGTVAIDGGPAGMAVSQP